MSEQARDARIARLLSQPAQEWQDKAEIAKQARKQAQQLRSGKAATFRKAVGRQVSA